MDRRARRARRHGARLRRHAQFRGAAASLVLAAALIGGCGDEAPGDREARLRQVIEAAQTQAEARDVDALMEHVASGYSDPRGNDARAIRRLLQLHFLNNRAVHLLTWVRELELTGDERAGAVIYVAMAGRPIPDLEALPRMRADVYRFEVEFRDDDGWQVTSARWQPARPTDLLEGLIRGEQ